MSSIYVFPTPFGFDAAPCPPVSSTGDMATPDHQSFAYQAQTADGFSIAGTVDADSVAAAAGQLRQLHLLVTALEPAHQPTARGVFRADDFLAFNQQLAQLSSGHLPVERTLRLLAKEMRTPAQSAAVDRVAAELEKGVPIGQAFDSQRGQFPPLYGRLLEAGVKSNNLPGVLLNLGRHLQLQQQLGAAVWRAAVYPLAVLSCLLGVLIFIWSVLIPNLNVKAEVDFLRIGDPRAWIVPAAQWTSYGLMVFIAAILVTAFTLIVFRRRATAEAVSLPVPLIGPVLRWSLLARWCDALQLAVTAGLDLPAAIALSADVVRSPRLSADSKKLIETLNAGHPLDTTEAGRLMPPLVPTALQLGIEQNDLPTTCQMLARTYHQQAEVRVAALPHLLSPLLLLLMALCVGLAAVAALLPLVLIINALAGLK